MMNVKWELEDRDLELGIKRNSRGRMYEAGLGVLRIAGFIPFFLRPHKASTAPGKGGGAPQVGTG